MGAGNSGGSRRLFDGRHLFNAFYRAVISGIEPREALMDSVQYIHDEIRTKQEEFGEPQG